MTRDELITALPSYLEGQRWYGGSGAPRDIALVDLGAPDLAGRDDVLHTGVLADGDLYQLLLARHDPDDPPEFVRANERAVVGEWHDLLLDPRQALELLAVVSRGAEKADRVRPVGADQSNTSVVYDERLILKLFRRLYDGPNPDADVTTALAAGGFAEVAEPVARWQADDRDLAFVQRFLAGATEGWALALTSLRDLLGGSDEPDARDPSQAGGDLSGEATRLGDMTARLHLELARAFGTEPGDAARWAAQMDAQVDAVLGEAGHGDGDLELDLDAVRHVADRLRAVLDPGPAIRVHGDYHLGQVMRTDAGWYVLDFEGEPARPLAERRARTSALRDVAGMLRSFHYAAEAGLLACGDRDDARPLAGAWEERNRQAFLGGYLYRAAEGGVLPGDPESVATVLAAFELDKAVYELAYETAYRPDWVEIPRRAIRRIVGTGER